MRRLGTGPVIATALAAGFLTTISLVLPWFTIAGKSRSSIDLLKSASALDVIEGGMKAAVIGGWVLAPVVVAVAMLVAASGRHRFAAGLLSPVVLLILLVVVIGFTVDAVDLAWGAVVGAVFAIVASSCAIMVLVTPRMNQ